MSGSQPREVDRRGRRRGGRGGRRVPGVPRRGRRPGLDPAGPGPGVDRRGDGGAHRRGPAVVRHRPRRRPAGAEHDGAARAAGDAAAGPRRDARLLLHGPRAGDRRRGARRARLASLRARRRLRVRRHGLRRAAGAHRRRRPRAGPGVHAVGGAEPGDPPAPVPVGARRRRPVAGAAVGQRPGGPARPGAPDGLALALRPAGGMGRRRPAPPPRPTQGAAT
jgi:hypothetical protein